MTSPRMRSRRSWVRAWVGVVLLGLAGSACSGAAPGAAAGADGASQPLPAGTVLRSTIAGGVAGRSDRLEVGADGVARLWVQSTLRAATRLSAAHRSRLDELLASGRVMEDEEASRSAATDGIRTRLAFAGRGRIDLRSGVETLTAEIGELLLACAEVWSATGLVVGHPTGSLPADSPARDVRIVVDQVLVGPAGSALAPGAIVEAEQGFLQSGTWSGEPRVFRLDESLVQRAPRSFTVRWARGVLLAPEDIARVLDERNSLAN